MNHLFTDGEPITDRTPQGIALAIGRLISTGRLVEGDKLPTVRAMAEEIAVSPTTVNDAWRILHSHGAITTKGRQGTFVRGPRQGAAGRYWQVPVDPGTFAIDLSTGTPDPELLPKLGPVLRQVHLDLPVTSYLDAPVLGDLEVLLRDGWPFAPELLTIVDGAQDGIDRLVSCLVGFGDTVFVNDPAFPPLLDMLDDVGARIVGIAMDDNGIRPDALRAALEEHEPVVLFVQPRAHNPTGATMTPDRVQELAAMVDGRPITVVEDDHSAAVSGTELATIGQHLPTQVVHIRSFSKSHGPDLRLAAIGGAAGPIDKLVRRRRLGPSWTSRLLQAVLLHMLEDDETVAAIARAGDEYASRRERFVSAMAGNGVIVGGSSGINVWVPVHDEQFALVSLAANGIGAAPGTPFTVSPPRDQHIRVSIGTLDDEMEEVAALVAKAATTKPGSQPSQSQG